MYGFFLRAVTLSALYFCMVYWTDVIEVVTLGGLVAGACIAGVGSSLVQVLAWRLGASLLRRRALLLLGSSCLTMDIMRILPGYTVSNKLGALILLAVFCLMVITVTEITLKRSCQIEDKNDC